MKKVDVLTFETYRSSQNRCICGNRQITHYNDVIICLRMLGILCPLPTCPLLRYLQTISGHCTNLTYLSHEYRRLCKRWSHSHGAVYHSQSTSLPALWLLLSPNFPSEKRTSANLDWTSLSSLFTCASSNQLIICKNSGITWRKICHLRQVIMHLYILCWVLRIYGWTAELATNWIH